MKKQLVVNLFSGPGVGKSTLSALVFAELKKRGVNVEMAREGVKDTIYDLTPSDGSPMDQEAVAEAFSHQEQIFEDQALIQGRMRNKVDVIIAECPLLLSFVYYSDGSDEFYGRVREEHRSYDNMNYFIERKFEYKEEGRYQDENGAKQVDQSVLNMIKNENISCISVPAGEEALNAIVNDVMTAI